MSSTEVSCGEMPRNTADSSTTHAHKKTATLEESDFAVDRKMLLFLLSTSNTRTAMFPDISPQLTLVLRHAERETATLSESHFAVDTKSTQHRVAPRIHCKIGLSECWCPSFSISSTRVSCGEMHGRHLEDAREKREPWKQHYPIDENSRGRAPSESNVIRSVSNSLGEERPGNAHRTIATPKHATDNMRRRPAAPSHMLTPGFGFGENRSALVPEDRCRPRRGEKAQTERRAEDRSETRLLCRACSSAHVRRSSPVRERRRGTGIYARFRKRREGSTGDPRRSIRTREHIHGRARAWANLIPVIVASTFARERRHTRRGNAIASASVGYFPSRGSEIGGRRACIAFGGGWKSSVSRGVDRNCRVLVGTTAFCHDTESNRFVAASRTARLAQLRRDAAGETKRDAER
ncbi:uncharacterized protein LOC143180183 [Calliopsis andreniformis]|uniref:uncharacterized protein LOC143180183 n=1 Tax=Calliopsis andreniformis TaxID=337506 RepID=UPI003FCC59BC